MIEGFKYSREEVVKMIQEKCERTRDGNYWTPGISAYISARGFNEDKDYHYKRDDFFSKVYFTPKDFDYFLAKTRKNNYVYETMRNIDKKFMENNYDTLGLRLKDKVKPYDFNVQELLDNYINMRYAVFNINI